MASLPPDHPLLKVYLHLKDRGQAEFANTLVNYADMASRQQAQLQLVQDYISELDQEVRLFLRRSAATACREAIHAKKR